LKQAIYFLLVLLGILFLNAASWFFVGKEKALDLSLNYFSYRTPIPQIDTLYVYSVYTVETTDGKILEFDDICNFRESTRSSFLKKLKAESQVQNLEFKNSTTKLFSDYQPGVLNFNVDLEYKFPFYNRIYSGVFVSGFVAEYEQDFIWFFYWWPIGEAGGGIS